MHADMHTCNLNSGIMNARLLHAFMDSYTMYVCDFAHGGLQDELHVIKYCYKLHHLRQKYSEILYDIAAFYDN